MTFVCEATEMDLDKEEDLFRFEVNDSYLAYTNLSNGSAANQIKDQVYAVKKSMINDTKSEFQANTRTEWRVIYVDAFKAKLLQSKSASTPSPTKIRITDKNPFDQVKDQEENIDSVVSKV